MQGPLQPYLDALGQIESGGDYGALGPMMTTGQYAGQRAVGKYQVMPGNIPQWTKMATGTSMSPDEFKNSPSAQDQVAAHYFGSAMNKYGTPQDAASVWFSGRPLSQAGNASDGYNTAQQYVSKFNQALKDQGNMASPMDLAFANQNAPAAAPSPAPAPTPAPSNSGDTGLTGALNGIAPALQQAGGYLMGISNPAGGAAMVQAANSRMMDLAKLKMMMKPQWGVIGKDPWTGVEKYGWINPFTQTVTGATGTGGGSSGGPGSTGTGFDASPDDVQKAIADGQSKGLTQDQILQSLPPMVGGVLGGMLKGQETPANLARNGSMKTLFVGLAHQLDPNFTEATYGERQAQAKDLATSGKLGQNLISANQLMNHLGGLYDDIDALKNRGSSWYNSVANTFTNQSDPQFQQALQRFNGDKQAVSTELTKLMRGTGGAEADVQAWMKEFDSNASPDALRAGAAKVIDLMRGRVEAATDGYNRAFGQNNPSDYFLSPKAKNTISSIEADMAKRGSGGSGGPVDQPPMQGAQKASDGNWYVPDPNRQGKYLRVDQ